MKQMILLILFNTLTLLGFAQDNHPVSWKCYSEKIAPFTYKVQLHATIEEPYHIYPQQSSGGGLGMPTQIRFTENAHLEFVGAIEEKSDEAGGGKSAAHYAIGVTFSQVVRLKDDSPTKLFCTIKYMACNDQMCLPPSIRKFTVELNGQAGGNAESRISEAALKDGNVSFVYEDFTMANTEGNSILSRDITMKSKYTFIDFWASWCAPCRAQGRGLIPLYNKYKSRGLDVIGVSLDTDSTAWKKAVKADGYSWANLSDLKGFDSDIVKKYNITAIPWNFLIDDKGNIIAMGLHGEELEAKLSELFK
ncbi:TlpA family protein disulfide reductase [Chitinophaga sp. Ak27]|uniref:TlpA family protein disulfide reductase n=1 Tax=Chitinophaga sp. Ak27 TaxID=2726116 RepID=UPI00145CB166|nr:TlpA disulfide reductase family protein [Chitinophaga sp. Ak27]NLU95682.1 TlpA family protein disulfide reductase [Chitinophaga sp. Ak27]